MTLWISAKPLEGPPDWLADFIEADSFEEALRLAHERARARFPGRPYRLTGVNEQSDESAGPVALMLDLTRCLSPGRRAA